MPLAVEYGLTNRMEILFEPVVYTAIRPTGGMDATGVGDVEITLTYLARAETLKFPAIAVASEVQVPSAKDSLIGTGQADFAAYLIGSKRWDQLDAHANLSYTVVGRPPGAELKNIFGFALAAEWFWGGPNELFGEVLGNTAASAHAESGTDTGERRPRPRVEKSA